LNRYCNIPIFSKLFPLPIRHIIGDAFRILW
jgi:hypothetical protein